MANPSTLTLFGNIHGRHGGHDDESQNEDFHLMYLCCVADVGYDYISKQ